MYVFTVLTFMCTYALNFYGFAKYGPIVSGGTSNNWGSLLAVQMLLPAALAIICLGLFKDRRLVHANRWFLGYFMFIVVTSLAFLVYDPTIPMPSGNAAAGPTVDVPISQLATAGLGFLGVILLVALNLNRKSRSHLAELGLSFGRNKLNYLLYPLLYAVIMIANGLLNIPFKLYVEPLQINPSGFALIMSAGIFNGFLTTWAYFFGEEFGWRVYLQERLLPWLGTKKGVIILGIIWGLWHAPVIAAGYNYPNHPVAGVICMTLFTIIIGIMFSYAVLKTGSVWIAALLHLVTNTTLPAVLYNIATPKDFLFSFGMGIYGILFMGVFAYLLWRYGNWQQHSWPAQ